MGSETPEQKMSGMRAALLYAIAIPRDILVFIFSLFIFIAPSLASTAVNLYLQGNGWTSWAAGLVGFIAGASTVAAEVFFAPITMALWVFGFIMAFTISLLGWIAVNTLLLVYRISPFNMGFLAKNVAGLGILTLSVTLMVLHQRKLDGAARKKWEADQAAQDQQRRIQAQMLQRQQLLAIQEAQEEAAEVEAQNVDAERAASDNNEEIPDGVTQPA